MNANESFDRTASHMAGKYVSYNEPVAWMMKYRENGSTYLISEKPTREQKISHDAIPLYTHPAKTLTDEEILNLFDSYEFSDEGVVEFAHELLRKAQEKC
jgi:rubrerythrin